jgi:hypothetical protein
MTISSATNRYDYTGSGSTGPFTITDLEITADTQLKVIRTVIATGVETELTKDAGSDGYTVDQSSAPFTSITTTEAVTSLQRLSIILNVPETQATDYVENDSFAADTHESALDKLTLIAKQLTEKLARSLKFAEGVDDTEINWPDPTSQGDKYIKFNSDASAVEYSTLSSTAGLGNVVEDTTPQLGGDLDANAFDIQFDDATGIRDSNDNEQLIFQETASATNFIEITNAATGNAPSIKAGGSDTNVDLLLHGQLTGNVVLADGTDTTKDLSVELSGATTAKTLTLTSSHTDDRTITVPDATDTLVGKATTDTLTNKTLTSPVINTGISGTAFLDEDDMSSDSASKVASQQSIKAYVDATYISGQTVQVVRTSSSAHATGTTTTPTDDTIPQNTEGTEFLTRAITPTSSSNLLKIEVDVFLSGSTTVNVTGALFQDSTADALAAAGHTVRGANDTFQMRFTYYMTAGTTSSTTFKFRAGGNAASTIAMNGSSSSRQYGGVASSTLTVTEIEV